MSNLIVVLIGITFYLGLSHFDLVREKLDMFLSVVAPFIVGFAVAYLLNTPAKFLERELLRTAVIDAHGPSSLSICWLSCCWWFCSISFYLKSGAVL